MAGLGSSAAAAVDSINKTTFAILFEKNPSTFDVFFAIIF